MTVVSAACEAATRWSASATRLRARRFASVRASSSIWRTWRASSWRIRSSERSSRYCFASATVMPGQPLELAQLALLRLLQLGVEPLRRLLAVGEALVAARELDELVLELVLLRLEALLGSRDLAPPLLHLRLDLRAQLDRFLAGLDARLAPHRFRFSLGVSRSCWRVPQRLVEAGRADRADGQGAEHAADDEADQYASADEHALSSGWSRHADSRIWRSRNRGAVAPRALLLVYVAKR